MFGTSLFLQFGLSLVLYFCVIHKSVAEYESETEDMSKLLDASNTTSPIGTLQERDSLMAWDSLMDCQGAQGIARRP